MILTLQPLTERVSDLAVVSQIAFIGLLSPYPFVEIELIEQRIIEPNEFRDAQPPHRADQPSLADGLDRFCQDHRGLQKSPITVHKNVGLVIGLLCSIGCNRRNNEVGRIAVCGVVLHHDHRADTALLGAKVRLQIGVVNITAQKFSVDWDHAHHRLQGKLWIRPAPL